MNRFCDDWIQRWGSLEGFVGPCSIVLGFEMVEDRSDIDQVYLSSLYINLFSVH